MKKTKDSHVRYVGWLLLIASMTAWALVRFTPGPWSPWMLVPLTAIFGVCCAGWCLSGLADAGFKIKATVWLGLVAYGTAVIGLGGMVLR